MKFRFLLVVLAFNFLVAYSQDSANQSFEKGFNKYIARDLDSAMLYFKNALELSPKHYKAKFYLGKVKADKRNFKEATEIFSNLTNLERSESSYSDEFWNSVLLTSAHTNYMAYLYNEEKSYLKEALSNADELKSQSKCDDEVYYLLSLIKTKQGKFGGAKSALKKALKNNPQYDEAYVKLASLESNKKKAVLYLAIGKENLGNSSMSAKRLEQEKELSEIDFKSYLDKKLKKSVSKLNRSNELRMKRCQSTKS